MTETRRAVGPLNRAAIFTRGKYDQGNTMLATGLFNAPYVVIRAGVVVVGS